jgi:glycosyltransferase involved in cell wall biosynthesis
MKNPTMLFVITRSDLGGAQMHVSQLLLALKDRSKCWLITGQGGWLTGKARGLGVPVAVLPQLVRQISPWKDLRALLNLYVLMRRLKPAVVSLHSTKAGLLGRVAARLAGVDVVVFTAHGWVFTEGAPWWRRRLGVAVERLAARLASKIVCVSEYDKDLALRWKVAPGHKLTVIHNGADPQPFLCKAESASAGLREPAVITTVGRLSPPKAPLVLLEALRNLNGRPFRALLVGDGPQREKVESLIGRAELADRVVLMGERRDIPEILRSSDIFVLSSWSEGLPRAVIEAMVAGLPVIASSVGGVPELVDHGITGLLVPPGNPAALAGAIRTLLEKPEMARCMGERGRMKAIRKFSLTTTVSKTLSLYDDLLGGNYYAGKTAGRTGDPACTVYSSPSLAR